LRPCSGAHVATIRSVAISSRRHKIPSRRYGASRTYSTYLQRPPVVVGLTNELVGFLVIRDAHVFAVPPERFAGADRDIAEQNGLRDRSAVVEVGARLRSALRRFDPLFVMPDRSR